MDVEYTPMSIDGVSGYFLSDSEYQKLYKAASGQDQSDYVEGLETELRNLQNTIQEAYSTVCALKYDLGNA